MRNCIFCKIAAGKLPCAKIWEDREHMAILDTFPNIKGQTLVITKKHYGSYVFDMPIKAYEKLMLAAKKAVRILEKGLAVKRVVIVMEGTGIDHAHLKLYPAIGLKSKHQKFFIKQHKRFEKYPGYTTTLMGPKADLEALKRLARKINLK